MSAVDVYGMTERLEPPILDAIIARLEARGRHPFFQRMLHEYLDAMTIDRAGTVLDLGCGTGVAARAVARRPGFRGMITGIDVSPYLTMAATRLAAEEGVGDRIRVEVGDTESLDISDASFDAVVAHTLVSHVANPLAVVQEAARVVKPGGMVGIFDGDFASLTFSQDDPVRGKEYDEVIQRAIVTNPRVVRDLPRLLRQAGLELVASFPYVLAEMGTADYWVPAIESFRRLVPQTGLMCDLEINAWADARLRESADGIFFGASNYYGFVARRTSA